MRRFLVERNLPAIGSAELEELRAMAARSNEALRTIGPRMQWVQSFLSEDKAYCVYLADNEDAIRRHSELTGFAADRITEITGIIDPTTARDGDPDASPDAS